MIVGRVQPDLSRVLSLNCLQKSAIWIPVGHRAVPIGGAGLAAPALIWSLTIRLISFFLAINKFFK